MRMHGQGLFKYLNNIIFKPYPLPHFTFPILSEQRGLAHAIFTRHGGMSNGEFYQLNVSYAVGDDPRAVKANLKIIKNAISARHLITMNQVHGTNIACLHQGSVVADMVIPDCDGVVTNVPGVAVLSKLADCQGVVIYSRVKATLGVAHCGWRGNVANILGKVVTIMQRDFGCEPKELLAGISPSLGPCCAEFRHYTQIFPEWFSDFMVGDNHFDLWGISIKQLVDAGLQEQNIQIAEVCTKCNSDLFYSYRKSKVTGRFAVVAMLTEKDT